MEKLFYKICNHEEVAPDKVRFTYKEGRISKYDTAKTLDLTDSSEPIYLHWANKKTDEMSVRDNCPVNGNCVGTKETKTLLVKVNFENYFNHKGDITEIYIRQHEKMENLMIRIKNLRGLNENLRFMSEGGDWIGQDREAAKRTAMDLELEYGDTLLVYAMQDGG